MNRIVLHVLVWVVIYIVYTLMLAIRADLYAVMLLNLVNVILYMLAYYTLRHIQLPFLYEKDRKGWFIASLVVSSVLLYLISRLGLFCLDGVRGIVNYVYYDLVADFLVKVIRFYCPAMVLLALESHYEGNKEQERIRVLEKEKLANELKFLKAQINPHFLFNTLSSLYTYVLEESPKAPEMILGLSAILDYVLYRSQSKMVLLNEELEAINNFVNLEKIRGEDRLTIDYKVEGDSSISISPLILMSIIENTFKIGTSEDIRFPKISIHIYEINTYIHCNVKFIQSQTESKLNTKESDDNDWLNIRRQLDLVYLDRYSLEIENEEDYCNVQLIINPI